MAVSSTANRVTYTGDGTTTSFSFPYYFFYQTDLLVYVWDTVAGGATLQVLNTGYTISGTQNSNGLYPSGATIVFGSAPTSTQDVVIVRNPAMTSPYSLSQNQLISSTGITQQFDLVNLQIQRLQDQLSRAIVLSDGMAPAFAGQLPSTVALMPNAYPQVNSTANGWAISPSPSKGVVNAFGAFTASSTSVSLTLATLPPGAILEKLAIKHTTAFAGTSITDVTMSVGISADKTCFIDAFDVFQSVGDTVFDNVGLEFIGSWANSTPILLTATSVGANLSALTAGSVSCYYTYRLL